MGRIKGATLDPIDFEQTFFKISYFMFHRRKYKSNRFEPT